jgi:hypothetical protein
MPSSSPFSPTSPLSLRMPDVESRDGEAPSKKETPANCEGSAGMAVLRLLGDTGGPGEEGAPRWPLGCSPTTPAAGFLTGDSQIRSTPAGDAHMLPKAKRIATMRH